MKRGIISIKNFTGLTEKEPIVNIVIRLLYPISFAEKENILASGVEKEIRLNKKLPDNDINIKFSEKTEKIPTKTEKIKEDTELSEERSVKTETFDYNTEQNGKEKYIKNPNSVVADKTEENILPRTKENEHSGDIINIVADKILDKITDKIDNLTQRFSANQTYDRTEDKKKIENIISEIKKFDKKTGKKIDKLIKKISESTEQIIGNLEKYGRFIDSLEGRSLRMKFLDLFLFTRDLITLMDYLILGCEITDILKLLNILYKRAESLPIQRPLKEEISFYLKKYIEVFVKISKKTSVIKPETELIKRIIYGLEKILNGIETDLSA